MPVSEQSSFLSKNITEFGITREGVMELEDSLKIRRQNSAAAKAYRTADAFIKGAMPLVEEPTRIRIGDVAEITIAMSTRDRKAKEAGTSTVRRKTIVYLSEGGFSDTKA